MYRHKTNRFFHVRSRAADTGRPFSSRLPQPYMLEINEDPEQLQNRYEIARYARGCGVERIEKSSFGEV